MAKSNVQKVALDKQQSRDIVKEIENFGVTEEQKIDIMYFLSLTLKDHNEMKAICNFLKNYKKDINNIEHENNNNNISNKIIVE